MSLSPKEIKLIIENSIAELNLQLPKAEKLSPDVSQEIAGEASPLDSLGLVTLIANIEDSIFNEGLELNLLDELVNQHDDHPFRTVGSLTDWICREALAHG